MEEQLSNCCGAADIYGGNLDNNEGVCADCGENCEMEEGKLEYLVHFQG